MGLEPTIPKDDMKTPHISVPTFPLLLAIVVFFALAGCSSMGIENKKVDYKSGATKLPPLEVPPDLTKPAPGDRFTISENDGETVAVYSSYNKADVVPSGAASNVLPQVKDIYLERNGTQRWLVVRNKAENVWPVVKAFWVEHGFTITADNPEAGLMETDWVENRAKLPKTGLRSVVGKVFDKLYSTGEKDMYRTRLERRQDGNSTEIYITHRGIAEVLSADQTTSRWMPRANDPELEATMLQILMVKLGGNADDPVAPQSVFVTPGQKLPESPMLQRITAMNILLSDPFDKSWRQVGLALEQAGIIVEDMDRTKGEYYLSTGKDGLKKKKSFLERLMFWRSEEDEQAGKGSESAGRYQVFVRESGSGSIVGVLDPIGGRDDTTQQITDMLLQQLTK